MTPPQRVQAFNERASATAQPACGRGTSTGLRTVRGEHVRPHGSGLRHHRCIGAAARPFDPHIGAAAVRRFADGATVTDLRDTVAVEEPLEIRVDGAAVAVTMRTPGEDEELAAGFLAGEGLIGGPDDVVAVGLTDDLAANVVEVTTRSGLRRDAAAERSFYMSSSCGVCGKGALEFVERAAPPAAVGEPIAAEAVHAVGARARARQAAFERTGGIHATALLDPAGQLVVVREDVGRHNAMDKAIGALLLGGRFPAAGLFAWVSGRASFELVQKCSLAGLAGLLSVGPPSSLAVSLARERAMLLCGFVRESSFNVYSGAGRIAGRSD